MRTAPANLARAERRHDAPYVRARSATPALSPTEHSRLLPLFVAKSSLAVLRHGISGAAVGDMGTVEGMATLSTLAHGLAKRPPTEPDGGRYGGGHGRKAF